MLALRQRYAEVNWLALEQTCKPIVLFACLWIAATGALEGLGLPTRWTPLG